MGERHCSKIASMQLFHELKQRFPALSDHVISRCIAQNDKDREACEQQLQKFNAKPKRRASVPAPRGVTRAKHSLGAADCPHCLDDLLEQLPESLRSAVMESSPSTNRRSSQPIVLMRDSTTTTTAAAERSVDDAPDDCDQVDSSAAGCGMARERSPSIGKSTVLDSPKVNSTTTTTAEYCTISRSNPTTPDKTHKSRGYTSVSLTVRPPSSEPQAPIDVSSSAGLTYCINLPVDSGASLRISLGPGNAVAARIRSSNVANSDQSSESGNVGNSTYHRRESSTSLQSRSSRESSPSSSEKVVPVSSEQPRRTIDPSPSLSEPLSPSRVNPTKVSRWSSSYSEGDEDKGEKITTIKDDLDDSKEPDEPLKKHSLADRSVPRNAPFDNVSSITWRRPDASTGAIPKSTANTSRHVGLNANVVGKTRSINVPRTLSFQQLPQQLEIAIPSNSPEAGDIDDARLENDLPLVVVPSLDTHDNQDLALKSSTSLTSTSDSATIGGALADSEEVSLNGPSDDRVGCPTTDDDGKCCADTDVTVGAADAKVVATTDAETPEVDNDEDCYIEDENLRRCVEKMAEDMETVLSGVEDEYKGQVLEQLECKYLLQMLLEDRLKEKAELEEDVQALNDLLKEIKQDKTVQLLESEIYQLQLACETMISQIDQHTNGEVPLGETNVESLQNFCAAQSSTLQAANPNPEANSDPSNSSATVAAAATTSTISDIDNQEETELRWCCKKCTYSNHHLMVECEMCTTPKGADEPRKELDNKNEADEAIKVQGKTPDIRIRVTHHNFSPRRTVHNLGSMM